MSINCYLIPSVLVYIHYTNKECYQLVQRKTYDVEIILPKPFVVFSKEIRKSQNFKYCHRNYFYFKMLILSKYY